MMKKPGSSSSIHLSCVCYHLVMEAANLVFLSNRQTLLFFDSLLWFSFRLLTFVAMNLSIITHQLPFTFQVVGTAFTHHQKCVLVDTQASGNNRKITAFIGGLDLCDGRYDTPQHRLFHDLDTVFKDDVHQPTYPVSGVLQFVSHFLILLFQNVPQFFSNGVISYIRQEPKLQGNHGMIYTARLMVLLHMMCF